MRKRRVLYVEGYDPAGAEGYFDLFRRSWKRFVPLWPKIEASHGELAIDSDDLAHWDIAASGRGWKTETRYEFLRQEHIIRAQMAEPLWRIVPRAIGWALDHHLSGTMLRIYRASYQYFLALLFFQTGLLLWLATGVIGGWVVAKLLFRMVGTPFSLAVALGVIAGVALFRALTPLANRLLLVQINSHWPYLLEYARGNPSDFDHAIEAGAQRLVAMTQADDSDEVVLIGHSGGGVIAPAVMARALEIDPDIGKHGPRVVLLTLGSLLPGAALHPRATALRAIVKRLAIEPGIRWIDTQSRKDVLNFWQFDPVDDLGLALDGPRHNPVLWKLRFRDLLSEQFYAKLRNNYFRMHYQFIMANDRRAAYDYFLLVAGPARIEDWVFRGGALAEQFGEDGSLNPPSSPLPEGEVGSRKRSG